MTPKAGEGAVFDTCDDEDLSIVRAMAEGAKLIPSSDRKPHSVEAEFIYSVVRTAVSVDRLNGIKVPSGTYLLSQRFMPVAVRALELCGKTDEDICKTEKGREDIERLRRDAELEVPYT